jgi:hypothetical protein
MIRLSDIAPRRRSPAEAFEGGGPMKITKEDLHAALTCLAERFPQTFVPDRYQPHRPLKVGIAADLVARCPELDRSKLPPMPGV